MKKHLLLGFFIAIILCAPTQASISQAASRVKNNLDLVQPSNQITQETPTPTITPAPVKETPTPTRKPRPTSTPIVIPPAASPSATTLMILVSLFAVIVVVVGVWINRPEK